jgi:hypothetical protein
MHPMDLSDILSPCTVAAFLTENFGVAVLHVPGSAEKFASLFPGMNATQVLREPDVASRVKELSDGAGITVERVDEVLPGVTGLAQRLERTLEAPIRGHLVAGPGGFSLRREESDVLILQIIGQNRWKVHGNADSQPSPQPTWGAPLNEGDVLYIPRGWWHEAAQGSSHGLRLIMAIDNPTGLDFLNFLIAIVKEQDCFRKDVPRFAGPGAQATYLSEIQEAVMRGCGSRGIIERFSRHLNKAAAPRPVVGVSWSPAVSNDLLITLAAPRNLRIQRQTNDTICFTTNRRRLLFPEDAAPLLHYLSDNQPVSIARFYNDFEGEFDREELSEFLSVLTAEQVFVLREPNAAE